MKTRWSALILVALMLFAGSASGATNQMIPMGGMNDSLTIATSQVYDTSTVISASDWSYIGAVVDFDILTTKVAAGAGYIYFEGAVSDTSHTWTKLQVVNVSDSLEVQSHLAVSGAVDVSLASIVTAMPTSVVKGVWARVGPIQGAEIVNVLPFKKIRMIVSDTNWNMRAKVKAYWVVRR